jgi:hypothetical protein
MAPIRSLKPLHHGADQVNAILLEARIRIVVACRTTLDNPELIKTCVLIDSGTLAPGTTPMDTLFKDTPEPRLTKESQRWVLQRYSFGHEHIDDEWVNALAEVAATKNTKRHCRASIARPMRPI